jgi:hypothetical protein
MAVAVAEDVALHQRLLANDPVAPSDLLSKYLDDLADWLIAHNRRVDPHDCTTAAEDALLALIKSPASYKPDRGGLRGYLQMSATGDLRNLLESARRHAGRNVSLELVELSRDAGKLAQEDADPADIVADREGKVPESIGLPALPEAVRATFTREEQQVRQLMWRGERSTAAYAVVLNIVDRPLEEQRQEVKRVKDRLKKRLQRAGLHDG